MMDLTGVKVLLAQGDRENAMALLASLLLKNRNDVGGWLLMGELIDDPARKRDCYRRVLRLSPDHLQALAKLQELEQSLPFTVPVTGTEADQAGGERPVNESMTRLNFIPPSYSPEDIAKGGGEIIGYVLVGLAAFLLVLYVIANPGNFMNGINVLYVALIFIGLVASVIILSVSARK